MNLAFSRMKKIFRKFGDKEYTFDDFCRIARRERINLSTYKMHESVRGYYCSERRRVYRKKFIVFNETLSQSERLYVAFHELAHHFLHSNYTNRELFYCRAKQLTDSAQDAQAEAAALVMIIPARRLLELADTPFDEIHGFAPEMLIKRQRIFENGDFGILNEKKFACEISEITQYFRDDI